MSSQEGTQPVQSQGSDWCTGPQMGFFQPPLCLFRCSQLLDLGGFGHGGSLHGGNSTPCQCTSSIQGSSGSSAPQPKPGPGSSSTSMPPPSSNGAQRQQHGCGDRGCQGVDEPSDLDRNPHQKDKDKLHSKAHHFFYPFMLSCTPPPHRRPTPGCLVPDLASAPTSAQHREQIKHAWDVCRIVSEDISSTFSAVSTSAPQPFSGSKGKGRAHECTSVSDMSQTLLRTVSNMYMSNHCLSLGG
ncbi:hypothetical protein WOLCODRAFT_154392 [Wolfiporia cocos MD-104 SS10]|uniref:Uncharacterized protein n=1 Tax=Wolfiporia cocos (strain MD-104) TaxID=742152 RepID=A0A2H3JWJ9_WOLCO|nr:hypothetical protein WOLCODRAFT_154392 [Wolfiporia cocos MD-104 SS10]